MSKNQLNKEPYDDWKELRHNYARGQTDILDRVIDALDVSRIWYRGFVMYHNTGQPFNSFALRSKTKAMVIHDRILTGRKEPDEYLRKFSLNP